MDEQRAPQVGVGSRAFEQGIHRGVDDGAAQGERFPRTIHQWANLCGRAHDEQGIAHVGHKPRLRPTLESVAASSTTLAAAMTLVDPSRPAIVGATRVWTYADLVDLAATIGADVVAAGGDERSVVLVEVAEPAALAATTLAAASVCAAASAVGLPEDHVSEIVDRLRPVLRLDSEPRIRPATPALRPGIDDVAIVFATSGSTGRPKLVPNTHRNMRASAAAAQQGQELSAADRCLVLGPMSHALGIRAAADAIWWGAAVVVPARPDPVSVAAALVTHRPTCVVAPPPLLQLLVTAMGTLGQNDRQAVVDALRFVRSGAAALRPGLAERLATALPGVAVLHGYGMTEAAKIACTPLEPDGSTFVDGCVGRPLGVEVRINDDDEIVVRGDAVSPGFADADGWFHTGDLGRLESDGRLVLLGRRDDVVSRGGTLVALPQLEVIAERHPGVVAALAAPVEHPTLGTDVVLGYVASADGTPDPIALRRHLLTALPAAQVPTRCIAMATLPMTASGKPSRAGVGCHGRRGRGAGAVPGGARRHAAAVGLALA